MKFIVSRSELSNLIRKIQNVVPQSPPIPVLSHFLVEVKEGKVVFMATDLQVAVECATKVQAEKEGAFSFPSRRFFQLIRELTDSNVEIAVSEGEMAEIVAGSSRFRLHGIDKELYPTLPDLKEVTRFSIESALLKELLYRTSFAVAKEDSRYALTGVLMRIEGGRLIFVGTDGKRLAKSEAPIALGSDFSGEFILPLKAVDEILKLLGEDESASLYLTADKVAIESGSTTLTTKLLSGNYPDFEQIIPTHSTLNLTLHREELISLLKQISLFTNENAQSVRFTFAPGELILTANCADIGEGKVSMPVNYSGPLFEIAFNPFFFLDVLRHSKDETIDLGLTDSYNPGILKDSFPGFFIVMPMRLDLHP
jgi:DNA polymerase III subunit beta